MERAQIMSQRTAQHGAAILTAMITVTLVATVAAAAMARQSSAVEVEAAERSRIQAQWLLRGAMDWSRLLLRQDAQSSGAVDHLAEPWAVPLQETKLSAFLAAQGGVTDVDASSDMSEAYLSGAMQDMQAKLNLLPFFINKGEGEQSLIHHPVQRLFQRLGLPQSEYEVLKQALGHALKTEAGSTRPLPPQTLQDLVWLGIAPQTVQTLEPYAFVHPAVSTVNINTATAQVIWALVPTMEWAQAQTLVSARTQKHFKNLQQAQDIVPSAVFPSGVFSVNSQFFSARGQVRMEGIALAMQADLQRVNAKVSTERVQSVGIALPVGIQP